MQFPATVSQCAIVVACKRFCIICALTIASVNAWSANTGPGLVVADLPVTHSLVSMVMGDIASPMLLIPGNASPHDYALRPSEAKNLQSADLLVWTSRDLSPWLLRALQTSRQQTEHIELMNTPLTTRLAFRVDGGFTGNHEHHHAEKPDSHQDSGSAPYDPHGWLDPQNGIYWLDIIAEKLSSLDSDNATTYRKNALVAQKRLADIEKEIQLQLADVADIPFIVFHDSYHYFEDRFNVYAQGAIALGDAELPGIRKMNKLRQQLKQYEQACIFTEPQFSENVVNSLTRGIPITVGSLDPLGTTEQPGPDLYPQVLRNISTDLHSCLTQTNVN